MDAAEYESNRGGALKRNSVITVRDIDPGDKSWVRREAEHHGVSMEEYVRRLIAGTAVSHGLRIVTRNERDFRNTGAATVNPWTQTRIAG